MQRQQTNNLLSVVTPLMAGRLNRDVKHGEADDLGVDSTPGLAVNVADSATKSWRSANQQTALARIARP